MLSTFLFKYVYRLKPIDYPEPSGTIPKSVLMMAPHTSMMDFVIGLSAMKYYDLHAKTIIKKEFFFTTFKKPYFFYHIFTPPSAKPLNFCPLANHLCRALAAQIYHRTPNLQQPLS